MKKELLITQAKLHPFSGLPYALMVIMIHMKANQIQLKDSQSS